MYNEEVKDLFLSSIKNINSRKAYKSSLSKISEQEERVNKDVFNMNIGELKDTLEILTKNTPIAVGTICSKISQYCEWAITNNFTRNIQLLSWLKSVDKDTLISKSALEGEFINEQQMESIALQKAENPQDGAVVVLLWYGVYGYQMSELRNIKKEDIKFNENDIEIKLNEVNKDGEIIQRVINIPSKFTELFKDAMKEEHYISYVNKDKQRDVTLVKNNYLFEPFPLNRSDVEKDYTSPILRSSLTTRLRRLFRFQASMPLLSAKSIITSSMIDKLRHLDKSFEDMSLDDYGKVLTLYKKIPNFANITVLRKTYELLIKNKINAVID